MTRRLAFGACLAACGAATIAASGFARSTIPDGWSADASAKLQSLTLTHLGDPPADPSNRYASNAMAAAFGRRVFFDSSFSINGCVACATCHLPNRQYDQFHNVGVGAAQPPDSGRAAGIRLADASDFNCLGRYSDASADDCAELRYAKRTGAELVAAFRTPSLRNVALRPPYGHDGEFSTLAAVLDHYNRAPAAAVGHSELEALHLTPTKLRQLEAFLRTLNGPVIVAEPPARTATR